MIAFLKLLPELIALLSLIFKEIRDAETSLEKQAKLKKITDAINASKDGDTTAIEDIVNK